MNASDNRSSSEAGVGEESAEPQTLTDKMTEKFSLDLDLSNLTVAGWSLVVGSILVALGSLVATYLVLANINPETVGRKMRALGFVVVLGGAGVSFFAGKLMLSSMGIPISKQDDLSS